MKLRPIAVAFTAILSSAAFAHGTGYNKQSQAQPAPASQVSEDSASASAAEQSPMGGAKSDTIKQVQEKLSQQGQSPGKADGILGPKTQAALKEFQQQNGLQPSGEADQQTLAALQLDESSNSSSSTGSSSSPLQDSSSSGNSVMSAPDQSSPTSSSEQAPAGSTGATSAQ
jgi:peptidoglycan hydrolase-like protein with peptidoglycan-binding domain